MYYVLGIRYYVSLLLITFFLTTYLFLGASSKVLASEPKIKSSSTVSAFIGDARFTLFGYTSPFARVIIQGQGIYDETRSDETGYFIFENRFSPLSPREACLMSVDSQGRVTQPVCLPPFDVRKNVTIGPVILSPTLSVNSHEYVVDEYGVLSGETVPNSDVTLAFFAENTDSSLPKIKTTSDINGIYSTSLPTNNPQTLRMYTASEFKEDLSGKSSSLSVKILPWWLAIIIDALRFLAPLLSYFIYFILLFEIFILFFLLWMRKRKRYPLAFRPGHDLVDQ